MEIKEKDKATLSDQSYCSHQQQINKEDEITQEKKQPVDKMTLLHQALSQASVTRAKRCKQQRLALSEMKKCDKSNQLQAENRLFQSSSPSEETFNGTSEFMEACSSAIKNHKLFPIVELMSRKCEVATQNLSEASFTMDDVFQQLMEMASNGDESLGSSELDVFLINSIIMLRLHLLELEKVAELCDDFKTKYLQTLRKKITQESMIGYCGDSDDELCNSSPELSEQSKNRTSQQTVAMMSTSKGMKNDAQESVEEDSCDSKRKAQLPAKAVELLKTWLFLHSSHPYPSEKEKAVLSRETGLQMVQINNWFINARRRILVQSKESPDIDFIQETSSNTDCALIPKRIQCNSDGIQNEI
uniref:BMA-PSA-3 n=1 Tax=Brugia malayi TaxID=6279 RepID=A0A0H5S8V9_BRUMA|nr:BMA-PSA-3 [Brugia malayi]